MRIITLITLTIISFSCKSQKLANGCWLPEIYIDSLSMHCFKNLAATIKPVKSLYVQSDTILIMSYQGDYLAAKTRKVKSGIEVTNFSELLNLTYPEAAKYAKEKCFLYQSGNHLMMNVGIETTRFINSKDGVPFKNPSEVYLRYKLSGHYLMEKNRYSFHPQGKIDGEIWSGFEVLRNGHVARDKSRGNYWLILVRGKDGEKKYAIQLNVEELMMHSYEVIGKSDFDIKVSKEPIFTLVRTEI